MPFTTYTTILIVFFNLNLLYKLTRDSMVHSFLKVVLWISYLGWHVIPFCLYWYTGVYKDDYLMGPCFFCHLVDEIYQLLLLLLTWSFIHKFKPPTLFFKSYGFNTTPLRVAVYRLACLALIIIATNTFFATISYADRNDMSLAATNVTGGFSSFVEYMASAILLYVILLDKKTFNLRQRRIATLIILFFIFANIIQARRIYMFYIVILIVYDAINTHSWKKLAFGGIVAVIAFSLLPAFALMRHENSSITNIREYTSVSNGESIMDEILTKTHSIRTSSSLIVHDGIGGGGIQIYTSTLYALIPRFIYSNKPQPGSQNGYIDGLPSRLAAKYTYATRRGERVSDSLNVGISSSIEALWVGGWLTFILQLIIGAVIIFLINYALISDNILFATFGLMLLNLPVAVTDISFVQIMINLQRYIVIFLILKIFFPLKKKFLI